MLILLGWRNLQLGPRRWWIVGGSRRSGACGRAGLSLAKGLGVGLNLLPVGGLCCLLLNDPGGGEVRLPLKLSLCVELGLSCLQGDTLGLGLGLGLMLCGGFRLLLGGYASGESIPLLLELCVAGLDAELGLGE